MEKEKKKLILVFPGGGVRGLATVSALCEIEKTILKDKIIKVCDALYGTSAGGLLALYLAATENDAETCKNNAINMDHMKLLFSEYQTKYSWITKKFKKLKYLRNLPLYSDTGKLFLAQKVLPDIAMCELKKKCVVVTYDLQTKRPAIHRSTVSPMSIRDIANTTSAAPIYFPAGEICAKNYESVLEPSHTHPLGIDIDGDGIISQDELSPSEIKNLGYHIDGGVAANNPCMIAAVDAIQEYGLGNFKILVIGTGSENYAPDLKVDNVIKAGPVTWLENDLVEILMNAPNKLNEILTRKLIGEENFLVIDGGFEKEIALDDVSEETSLLLERSGKQWVNDHRSCLEKFLIDVSM